MRLDLNLLTALDALLEEGSVTGAAERLRLSAPAMSRTLARLRRATGDEILVRTGRTMTPTPWALEVRTQVNALVAEANDVLTPRRDVDLATLERVFVLRLHDAIAAMIVPDLVAAAAATAPGVRLRFVAEAPTDTEDLRRARVDLEVTSSPGEGGHVRSESLGADRLVVVMHAEHPCARGSLTAGRYAAAQHLTVSRRGRLEDPVDGALAELGLRRRVVAAVPSLTVALRAVEGGNLLVTAPEAMSRPFVSLPAAGTGRQVLLTRTLPVPMPPVPITMAWHQRYDGDPAHRWLRAQVRTAVHAVTAPT